MSKKTVVLGLVGALGLAAFGTAANADSFRYPQHVPTPAPVAAPVRPVFEHRVNVPAPVPAIPTPPVTQPTAYGQWSWNGYRYVWVARQPTAQELRIERYQKMEQARKAAEAKKLEQQRIAEAKRLEQQRIAEARRTAEMKRLQEQKRVQEQKRLAEERRAEQARREHDRHVAPDGTRVVINYGHK